MDLPEPINVDGDTIDMSDLIHEITQNGYLIGFGCSDQGQTLECVISDAPVCNSIDQVTKVKELIPVIEIERGIVDVLKMTTKSLYEDIKTQPEEGRGSDG